MPPLVMFDLDHTLTESKQPLSRSMAHLLALLIERTKVAVISGGALPQFLSQIADRLPKDTEFSDLYFLPVSGASLYAWRDGMWKKMYEERIPEEDAEKIMAAMRQGASASGTVDLALPSHGPRVEYRGGQVTFSALGQKAPPAEKRAWDPKKEKRRALQAEIQKRLPEGYTAAMGGSTSIDVTKNGVDKAFGLHRLANLLRIPESEIIYVGDELVPYGNDEAVFKTEAQTKAVENPTATARWLGKILGLH